MLAYVKLVQKREKEIGVDVLTHQQWSGAAYVDGILGAIQSGSSATKGMGEGNTEAGSSDFRSLHGRPTSITDVSIAFRVLIMRLSRCNRYAMNCKASG